MISRYIGYFRKERSNQSSSDKESAGSSSMNSTMLLAHNYTSLAVASTLRQNSVPKRCYHIPMPDWFHKHNSLETNATKPLNGRILAKTDSAGFSCHPLPTRQATRREYDHHDRRNLGRFVSQENSRGKF
mmetsp:Transcript_2798/g.3081  ORF Transcript_2798/g.3081 Transcript_2798/m.3081 type:complete len:130 (+) Transcript_2798:71-460(+)